MRNAEHTIARCGRDGSNRGHHDELGTTRFAATRRARYEPAVGCFRHGKKAGTARPISPQMSRLYLRRLHPPRVANHKRYFAEFVFASALRVSDSASIDQKHHDQTGTT